MPNSDTKLNPQPTEELATGTVRLLTVIEALARERAVEQGSLLQILDALPEGILVVDPNGRVILCNASMSEIWGEPPGQPSSVLDIHRYHALGVHHMDGTLFEPHELPLIRSLEHGEVVHGLQALAPRPGAPDLVPLRCSSVPLRDAAGAIVGAVGVYQDISAIREAEQQKDAFLASTSHDLRAPLTTIRGLTQLLMRRLARAGTTSRDDVTGVLSGIDTAVSQMTAMIEELLDLSQLQMDHDLELSLEPVDLAALVRAAEETYRKTAPPAQLVVEGAEAELIGNWDTLRLQRVLDNLLSNAIKYSPNGGTIRVILALEDNCLPSDTRLASGRPPEAPDFERWARLTVQDEGIGIPAADLPHIFERFHRGANAVGRILGIGLGLSGAKRIVEQHGGTIAVASREGSGTTVAVCLPLAPPEAAPTQSA